MPRKPILILILVLSISSLLGVFHPGGLLAYIFPCIYWALLALATLSACGLEKMRSWFNKRISSMATLAAVLQIFILMDAGLLTRFGKSPYSFTPMGIATNLILVSATLLGMELSRGYLMKNLSKKKPFFTLGLVTLLYTFINISLIGFLGLLTSNEPLRTADFLGTKLLPTVTENLLASYLALLGGPIASLAYRAPLQAFQWFSPILPDLPWGYEALIGVMAPTIAFLYINQVTTPNMLRRIGIPTETKRPRKPTKAKKSPLIGWMTISILCVLTIWLSTGLLGPRLTIVLSGSMTPTIHRVINIQQTEGTKLLITKGDANNAPDPDPVRPEQLRGKVIYIIPKLGWITIHTRTLISTLWSLLSTNTTLAYATLATIILTSSIYAIHKHKSRPRHWRRKVG